MTVAATNMEGVRIDASSRVVVRNRALRIIRPALISAYPIER
jgi:hypothetical protein